MALDFPASFMLIASMNPCPCGFFNHPEKDCTCPPGAVQKYLNKISGQFVIGTGQPKNRKKVRNVFDQIRDDQFIKLVNKSADLSSTVKLGKGIIINSLTCIAAHTAIGDFSFINRGCTIGHHTNLEKYVTINPGVNIAGNVSIGEGSLIGLGSNVIDGIKIGSNSIIGAGSVVTKDIPDNVVAYGSPCKIIRANEA